MVISSFSGVVANMACQCASISPGINVRPPPSIRVVSARRSVGIGLSEIFSITLPRTSTFEGAESLPDFPSKIRTLEKRVTGPALTDGDGDCAQVALIIPNATPNEQIRSLVFMLYFNGLPRHRVVSKSYRRMAS